MKAEIITVGTELLRGTIRNTDAETLCSELGRVGVEVGFQTSVDDDLDRIVQALQVAAGRSEVIVVTGGLGPTHDDLTRHALSRATGRELELDPDAEAALRRLFEERETPMAASNLSQAMLPSGASPIPNLLGTACGIELEHEGVRILALPGVPAEMTEMLAAYVVPALSLWTGKVRVTRILRITGISESVLAARIEHVVQECRSAGYPSITILSSAEEIELRIEGVAENEGEASRLIEPTETRLRSILGEVLYGAGDQTLEQVVLTMASERGLTLAVAESFTGGEVASRLVAVPGASAVLKAGFVTYAIESKVRDLGVDPGILGRYGAVSGQTAIAMAEGARTRAGTSVGLSTTGEAGPLPEEKPVGTMFIGLAWERGSMARALQRRGAREQVRARGAQAALDTLRLWMAKGSD
jgi:nicotinamide-nucleotide amidase